MLLAGAARIDITPEAGVPLMGYGARVGTATGVADRIYARALALSLAHHSILVVSAELCLMSTVSANALRVAIASDTGLPVDAILVACTHTHSGPDTGVAEANAGRPVPAHSAAAFAGIRSAAAEAFRRRQPARLAWRETSAQIGRNRRAADAPIDSGLEVLRVSAADGRPIAVLFRHSCHGTVRGHDNLEVSGDWPGAASATIEAATGAVAPFLLGAHADVDPRTRGLMDLAIPGQSIGLGAEAVRVLGREAADAVLAALPGAVDEAEPRLAARTARVKLPLQLGELAPAELDAELARRKREVAALVGRGESALPRMAELYDLANATARDLPIAEARERIAAVRGYIRDRTAPFFVPEQARQAEVEVQLLAIGRARLLALPLEPTSAVGLDWRARVGAHGLGLVIGIGNGWLRYLPHAKDLAHPLAHQHYEVLNAVFAAGACEALLSAGHALARELA
ncbi:MAG TPA: neutral/alkaline non-lysosomal ceramidase N-terminal domain-containing protein [Myxococcota bacterium]|nr:neutral/alkaline non-lysosomal ceramidase N-terminal domain-containing protein [Myxococcota bacterium]